MAGAHEHRRLNMEDGREEEEGARLSHRPLITHLYTGGVIKQPVHSQSIYLIPDLSYK